MENPLLNHKIMKNVEIKVFFNEFNKIKQIKNDLQKNPEIFDKNIDEIASFEAMNRISEIAEKLGLTFVNFILTSKIMM